MKVLISAAIALALTTPVIAKKPVPMNLKFCDTRECFEERTRIEAEATYAYAHSPQAYKDAIAWEKNRDSFPQVTLNPELYNITPIQSKIAYDIKQEQNRIKNEKPSDISGYIFWGYHPR